MILMVAHVGGAELWLDSAASERDSMFQYCTYLTEFPLFS